MGGTATPDENVLQLQEQLSSAIAAASDAYRHTSRLIRVLTVLGLVMAYGILRNRRRTRAEKQITEQATKSRYAEQERDRVRSGGE